MSIDQEQVQRRVVRQFNQRFQLRLNFNRIRDYVQWVTRYRRCPIASKQFSIHGKSYPYFVHHYNHTWRNERAVEIPVVWDLLNTRRDANILEIGNVLYHYFPLEHDVVDKYERFSRSKIIQEDIVNYETTKKYDLILCVSTLEHIGWDESPKDPDKLFLTLEKVTDLLVEGGTAVFTLPVGYNPHLDEALRGGRIRFSKTHALKRMSALNEWTEVDPATALECRYGKPFPNANGLIIGVLNSRDPPPCAT